MVSSRVRAKGTNEYTKEGLNKNGKSRVEGLGCRAGNCVESCHIDIWWTSISGPKQLDRVCLLAGSVTYCKCDSAKKKKNI